MIFAEGYSKYMPTPYSYYISDFSKPVFEFLLKSKPFARYHKDTQDFEVTKEVFKEVCKIENAVRREGTVPYTAGKDRFTLSSPATLYSYQQDAVDYAKDHFELLINFSQGMGKTLTSLRILEEYSSNRNLIITGVANLQEEWLKDSRKHPLNRQEKYIDTLNIQIVGNTPDSSVKARIKWLKQEGQKEKFTHLIGIESLRNTELISVLNAIGYTAIILDECQSAKGTKADQTQGLHDLRKYSNQRRIALSGTPIINSPLEYYSVLRFLNVLYYRNNLDQCARTTFENYYGVWGRDFLDHLVCTGYKNLGDLALLLEPVLCFAPKSLLNLKPKLRELVHLSKDSDLDAKICLYNKGSSVVKASGYTSLPSLAAEIQFLASSAQSKIDYILTQPRSLVFSRYTRVLRKVKEALEAAGKKVLFYHGELSMKERLQVLDTWKGSEEYDILLLSINAARYGLNLQEVQTTIFLEPPTSFAILEQAEDRAHRIGQEKEVHSYILISNALDTKDWRRLLKKQASIDEIQLED